MFAFQSNKLKYPLTKSTLTLVFYHYGDKISRSTLQQNRVEASDS